VISSVSKIVNICHNPDFKNMFGDRTLDFFTSVGLLGRRICKANVIMGQQTVVH
jgi:hypothetical protein